MTVLEGATLLAGFSDDAGAADEAGADDAGAVLEGAGSSVDTGAALEEGLLDGGAALVAGGWVEVGVGWEDAGLLDSTSEAAVNECVLVVLWATETVVTDVTVPVDVAELSVLPPTSGSQAPSPMGSPSWAKTVGRLLR